MPRRRYLVQFGDRAPLGLMAKTEGFMAERRIVELSNPPGLALEYVIYSAGKTIRPYLLGKTLREAQYWVYKRKGRLRRVPAWLVRRDFRK